jgi:chromosomal replication initiation ATPase DnaA
MKKHIFDKFVSNICSHTKIKKEDLLKKNKFADVVLARQTLFYVCYNRGIKKSIINQYMTDEGYDIGTSAINYGINTIKDLIDKDLDFLVIVDKLSKVD